MSDNEEQTVPEPEPITAKDPKRVEQGKRLAAISKEAKERKMRERLRKEDFSYLPWIGYGVASVSSLMLLWMLLSPSKENPPELEKTVHTKPSPKKEKKKFEGF